MYKTTNTNPQHSLWPPGVEEDGCRIRCVAWHRATALVQGLGAIAVRRGRPLLPTLLLPWGGEPVNAVWVWVGGCGRVCVGAITQCTPNPPQCPPPRLPIAPPPPPRGANCLENSPVGGHGIAAEKDKSSDHRKYGSGADEIGPPGRGHLMNKLNIL